MEIACDSQTVINDGPDSVYYSDTNDVTTTSYEGTVASGGSTVLEGTQWFVTTGRAQVRCPPVRDLVGSRVGTQAQLTAHIATLASGTEYSWTLTDGNGVLLDIISGKKP